MAGLAAVSTTTDARAAAFGLRISSTIIGGARTTYVDEGSGPGVLLLHGAPMTSLGFVRVIRELKATHRLVAPDLPGFGGSETPKVFEGTLDEYARRPHRFPWPRWPGRGRKG